ncbi:hypothetical protein V2J09_012054 [Rumex salicifolius]
MKQKLLSVLKKCSSTRAVKQVHAQMLTNSVDKPNFILSKLIDMEDYSYAFRLFSSIPQADEYAFNVMIRGLTTTWKHFNLALEFYYEMKISGLKPDNFTYPFVFIACGNILAYSQGLSAHSSVIKSGLNHDDHVSHSVITMYSKFGDLACARKVFDEIVWKDLVSWNSMISGYAKMGFASDAVELFQRMREDGFGLDEMTLVSVLTACGDLGELNIGRQIEDYIVKNNWVLNTFVGTALINLYGKCGELELARKTFEKMPKKDVVTWNAMISGYAQNGASEEALLLLKRMTKERVKPDKITIIELLSACASAGNLIFGKCLEAHSLKRGLQNDVYITSALIDMYAKCGCIDIALRVFENIPLKNQVSWNTMISALAFHGHAIKALEFFNLMLMEAGKVNPDHITFIAVLSACVHSGLVNDGYKLFNLMTTFDLAPKIKHYSCMVDLLARSGHVSEAWDFIKKMPGNPDEIVLGSLLGACHKAQNFDVGEKVIQLLLEIAPSDSGNYIVSSKVFANMKRWDDAAKMRALMRQKGVAKTPGCSWIEIEHQLYEFRAGDGLNLSSLEMCSLFSLLNNELMMECIEDEDGLL